MIKLPTTKIQNSSDKIDIHLDRLYNLKTEFGKVDEQVINNLLESIDSWKDCISELEIEIKGNQGLEYELKNDETNDELILY
jgi:hypothetical protein|tara:strand:+ start:333 stop:578 length:246 start_codon:yes stop_codon:yes gene_type:complete